ncbi:hypothetical protein FQA39_LY02149 [Lamprigera yunnana]|nr:hypothetical protein FQA39_LY02149 [Lamprigera yunnana]
MEPNYLKIKEITFEIACRGRKPLSTNQDARRMQLRALLKREKLSKPIALIQPFDWDKNISEITESIKDLEFSLTAKDIRSAQIQSRLMHLDNRLTLLNPPVENADQTSLKQDLYGQFLVLEGMLDETMELRELSSAPLSVPLKITSTFSDLPSHINTVTTQAPIMVNDGEEALTETDTTKKDDKPECPLTITSKIERMEIKNVGRQKPEASKET